MFVCLLVCLCALFACLCGCVFVSFFVLFVWLVGWFVRSFVLFVLFGLVVSRFQFVAFGGFSLFHVFGCLLASLLFVCV